MGYIESLQGNPNNFSNWFPKIKDCGIAVPETVIIPATEDVGIACFQESSDSFGVVLDFVKNTIRPILNKAGLSGESLFIKNGCFSNKFDFNRNCGCLYVPSDIDIAEKLININYMSEMYGAMGGCEFVFRKFIGSFGFIEHNVPCIYNGMPLRPEFRVFYDFNSKEFLYIVNYWDWNYCHERICDNATDKIIYEAVYPKILEEYETRKDEVIKIAKEYLKDVDLNGKWSVDFLYDAESDTYYLIDMATAKTSAYWKDED